MSNIYKDEQEKLDQRELDTKMVEALLQDTLDEYGYDLVAYLDAHKVPRVKVIPRL